MSHLELGVRDLDDAILFAREVTLLRVTDEDDDAVYLSCNERHHDLVLRLAPEDCCLAIGFEAAGTDQLEVLAQDAVAAGASGVAFDTPPGTDAAVRFAMPDGRGVEIVAAMNLLEQTEAFDVRRPRRFGHVSLKTEDPLALERFLSAGLGLRTSDRVGDKAVWMRGDSDHHGVAIMREPIGIHHYAYEMPSWESFRAVADDLRARGRKVVWGPGRHGPGNNIFLYFLNQVGCVIECYLDLEQVEHAKAPGRWPDEPSSFNVWGPPSPHGWHDHGLPHRARQLA